MPSHHDSPSQPRREASLFELLACLEFGTTATAEGSLGFHMQQQRSMQSQCGCTGCQHNPSLQDSEFPHSHKAAADGLASEDVADVTGLLWTAWQKEVLTASSA